jgi:hypothetical protein
VGRGESGTLRLKIADVRVVQAFQVASRGCVGRGQAGSHVDAALIRVSRHLRAYHPLGQ